MHLEYTLHAREKLAERGISEADVEATIAGFQVRWPDPDGNPCYVRAVRGRWLKLVIAADSTPPRVITVFFIQPRTSGERP